MDGQAASVEQGMQKFGADSLDTRIHMYDLKAPRVLDAYTREQGDTCYIMQCQSGLTTISFEVCWWQGKIIRAREQ